MAARVLRAQIAMQRGEYEAAFAGLSEVAAADRSLANAELALWHAKTGAPHEADALLVEVLAQTSPRDARRRAWTLLQRGRIALDRGANLLALQHFQDADVEFSGWWLVEEHIAEAHDRLGEHARAIAIYEELVRAHGMPQHMDALALARRHAGRDEEGAAQAADALLVDLLAGWPEAAMGHGLEHALLRGDAAHAVELAEANHAVRPGGDAKVALARAYLAAGRPADALAIARRASATAYRTAALHRVTADAHASLGDAEAAAQEHARCIELDPSCSERQHAH
jgi:tetratricopeptide (TPR) repeat protein